jgi:two-component system CheB/CheR fusion protein
LTALEEFFVHMPSNSGIAFIVVQHLSPDHASTLDELLARCTQMPVEQARDGTVVVPDTVYVIPPNATLTIDTCTLHVESPLEARGRRTPIDSLFSSLAADRGQDAICIMLSGTGTDGTRGLRAIKEHGGMAMAQTVESARYDAMLRSAISTGLVDHILPVKEMPAKLIEYVAHLREQGRRGNVFEQEVAKHSNKIYALLRRRVGHDFSEYKEGTITRRIERRMKALQIESVEQYLEALNRQPDEANLLFKDLLIGVTEFFRDSKAFEALNREVIPKLFERSRDGKAVRICVVGCATGEEAYSLAILLCEYASTLDTRPEIRIFATDIDERSLEAARKGFYPESIAERVSAERLERFFVKHDDGYQVKRALRELCVFSVHSFIKDPPFSRIDLISCRNVMIYIGENLQRKVVPLFHYALRPGGYLFLGPSENINSHRELFRSIDKKHRIFQKQESIARAPIALPLGDVGRPRVDIGKQLATEDLHWSRRLERIILRRYTPACVVVNESGDALYFSGGISRFLEQPMGSPDTNVVNMAGEDLRIPLRAALHKAFSTRERVVQRQLQVEGNSAAVYVDLSVEPLTEIKDTVLFMVMITDSPPDAGTPAGDKPALDASSEEVIRHLEKELQAAREHAQAMLEELESSNEELSSANEEFQSTNEELETSKEELQSFNEELETVNFELNRKVSELDTANSDLQNLLNSTQIATVFLDTELNVRNFTPAAAGMFRLIGSDIGRPLTDLAGQLTDVDLAQDAKEVLRSLSVREKQVAGTDGRYYQQRILPYRTVANVIAGVVLTFVDVTQIRRAEESAKQAKRYAESIIDTVREPLIVLDSGLHVLSASKAFYDTFQVSSEETLMRSLFELGVGHWDVPELRQLLVTVMSQDQKVDDYEISHDFPKLGRRTMLLSGRRVERERGKEPVLLLAIEDVTDRKRMEQRRKELEEQERTVAVESAVREMEAELAHVSRALTVGELATSIAHEVNQPLAGIVTNAETCIRWLKGKPPDLREVQDSLELIVRDGNRASEVIRRIREFLRKDGRQNSEFVMNEVIAEAVAIGRAELSKADVSVSVELDLNLPPVWGDRIQLQQVILNLVMNGREAMESVTDRPRQLSVFSQSQRNGLDVLVGVRDTGTGVDGGAMERMFDAFFTTKSAGMGMGLSISRSIIEAHGGRIWATRNEDSGITVRFTVPARGGTS